MNQSNINASVIEEWISGDYSAKAVEATLISKGYDLGVVKEYIFEFKRLKRIKHNLLGLMILSYSTLILVVACFIAFHKY